MNPKTPTPYLQNLTLRVHVLLQIQTYHHCYREPIYLIMVVIPRFNRFAIVSDCMRYTTAIGIAVGGVSSLNPDTAMRCRLLRCSFLRWGFGSVTMPARCRHKYCCNTHANRCFGPFGLRSPHRNLYRSLTDPKGPRYCYGEYFPKS